MENGSDREFLTDLLKNALESKIPSRVTFPEARLFPDAQYSSMGIPRLIFPLEHEKPVRAVEDGVDKSRNYRFGDLLYITPYGWTAPYWDKVHTFCSVVYYPTYVRFLFGSCDGSGSPPARRFWHTTHPLESPGHHLLQSLNQLPRFHRFEGDAKLLTSLLLHFSLSHLLHDEKISIHPGKAFQTYQLICDYLNQNAHLPISRDDVAAEFCITASHISRLLHEHGDTSFSRYLLRLRMERALELLADRSLPVKEVAFHCGYRDTSYFIRSFSSYHGVSPGKWRL